LEGTTTSPGSRLCVSWKVYFLKLTPRR
jgi:hypothetical protein